MAAWRLHKTSLLYWAPRYTPNSQEPKTTVQEESLTETLFTSFKDLPDDNIVVMNKNWNSVDFLHHNKRNALIHHLTLPLLHTLSIISRAFLLLQQEPHIQVGIPKKRILSVKICNMKALLFFGLSLLSYPSEVMSQERSVADKDRILLVRLEVLTFLDAVITIST